MSHLVAPRSFRSGKTQPWYNNVLTRNNVGGSNLTAAAGLEKLARRLLKKKRLYVVNANVYSARNNRIEYKLLFVPRIKIRINEKITGNFSRKLIYKTAVNADQNADNLKKYADLRKSKIAKLKRFKKHRRKLNKWLSKRAFRGAQRTVLLFSKPAQPKIPNSSISFSTIKTPLRLVNTVNELKIKSEVWKSISAQHYNFIKKRYKWKFDKLSARRFKSHKFSALVSRIINKSSKISCLNFFSYVVQKQILDFKSHQKHFWNFRFRRYRFQFKNYYDIMNSFLFLGILDNAESFFLSVLRITLPLLLKFRKFFKFLSLVIKYLPEINNKFAVFRLFVAGKLAGGTKRTKFHKMGYGVLPVQSLTVNAINNFFSFTHVYGEFGVRLLMSKVTTDSVFGQLGF